MKRHIIIFSFLLLLPFSFAMALTAGNVYTDSVGNKNYTFSDGSSGYSYKDSVGYTHYQFSDGLYGSAYTDITGSTHYYFDNLQKNKYTANLCEMLLGNYYYCMEESQYQEIYNNAAQGLPSCTITGTGEAGGSISIPSSLDFCTVEGREKIIMSGVYGPNLKMCREHIELYKTAKATYDKCIQNEDEKWEKLAQAKLDLLKYQIDLESKKTNSCPDKSSINSEGNCVCDSSLIWNRQQTQCVECASEYSNSHYGIINGAGGCYCDSGYNTNKATANCDKLTTGTKSGAKIKQNENIIIKLNNKTEESTLEEEKRLSQNEDKKMAEKLSGRILLQVEKNGEGWYLNPDDKKKYYLGRPADAFNVMKNLGLGIKHSELKNYLDSKFPSRLAGKIMLDVEQNGEAYYINPIDLKGYFLNRPADAFKVMRDLGLGISNNDVRKINVGETE